MLSAGGIEGVHEGECPPELALDPSDPLSLLLNNSADTDSDLSQTVANPDWSQFTSLWQMSPTTHQISPPTQQQQQQPPSRDTLNTHPSLNMKPQDMAAVFDFFPMDLELAFPSSVAVAVDPSMLYLNNKGLQFTMPETTSAVPIRPQDLLGAPSPSSAEESSSRTSSSPGSPSSGFGSSPVVPHAQSTTPPFVPQSSFPALPANPLSPPTPFQPSVSGSTPFSSPSHSTENTSPPATTVLGRSKTSHTTIERRYRTNLNARIQSLKAAVPALRVLDPNHRNDEYMVDERGYIDGVKVARKGSKANVLGKAVEYIQVLKRREARLKREKDGLRSLICRFPGGENILTEWESEWTKKYGGPERDEIDNVGVEEVSDDEDGDEDDDPSERARKKPKVDSLPQKKEKRKIAPAVSIAIAPALDGAVVPNPVAVPEKRKRGRPRKIQPNVPAPLPASGTSVLLTDPSVSSQSQVAPQVTVQHVQPQQYLLAVFALFSFFNSPLTSSPIKQSHHTHEGTVLSHVSHAAHTSSIPISAPGWAWNDVVEVIHLLASILILVSIIVPWIPLPRRLSKSRILKLIPFSSAFQNTAANPRHNVTGLQTPPVSPDASESDSESGSSSNETVRAGGRVKNSREGSNPLSLALSSKGSTDEYEKLVDALEVSFGFIGLLRGVVGLQSSCGSQHSPERRAWMRLAELIALRPQDEGVSIALRWQVYNRLATASRASVKGASPVDFASDLCTLALLACVLPLPFAHSRAEGLWNRARGIVNANVHGTYTFERLVFEELTLEDAVECLSSSSTHATELAPISVLASILLQRRLLSHASMLFVHRVTRAQEEGLDEFPSEDEAKKWRETIENGLSVGGDIAALCGIFKKVLYGNNVGMEPPECGSLDASIWALLAATILHQRLFTARGSFNGGASSSLAGCIPSPPPSPPHGNQSGQPKDLVLQLRCVLGSSVFEQNDDTPLLDDLTLEDARDRVVDQLVNLERERRSRSV
ncbi:hypothetical protein ID866_8771 [Astraeus odoratus]|nr:hypothetical protein ID866_8771 [Astraeus odoratus]